MSPYGARPSGILRFRKRLMALVIILCILWQAVPYAEPASAMSSEQASGHEPLLRIPSKDLTIHFIPAEPNYNLGKAEPKEGVYLGAYVLQDETIQGSMQTFNDRTGKQHASFFKYVGYGQPFPSAWVEQVKLAGAFPHIAWEPNKGLEQVQNDAYIREFAKQAKQADIPIFLRFASEMNGTWANYSGDPKAYKEIWRLVHDIFEKEAPKVAMVWTVLAFPVKSMEQFYPGERYVDWVGVNVYNVKYHNGDIGHQASYEDPHDLLNYVYNRYSRTKPIQLSEFGVTHYNTTDGKHDNSFAINRMSRLYRHLKNDYPRVKAVYYFDVNNIAAYNQTRRINDYSITGKRELLEAYRRITASDYFLSTFEQTTADSSKPVEQRFTYRGAQFEHNGILYVEEQFFPQLLQVKVKIASNQEGNLTATLLHKDDTEIAMKPVKVLECQLWTGTKTRDQQLIYRKVRALPLRQAVRSLGYEVNLHGNNIYIQE